MRIDRSARGPTIVAPRSNPALGGAAAHATAPRAAPSASSAPAGGRVAGLAGMETLLALQQIETDTERRRRALRAGSALLDRLADLHRTLLDGAVPESTLLALRSGLAELRSLPDDAALGSVLVEIAVRVEVELAKLERAESAADPVSGTAASGRVAPGEDTLAGRRSGGRDPVP